MLSKRRFVSGLLALGSLVCVVQAVWATCYDTRNKNCCDHLIVDKTRTCSEAPCPDVFLRNDAYTFAAQVQTGLDSSQSGATMQQCCKVQYYGCIGGQCKKTQIITSDITPSTATGGSCDESGGSGGTPVTIDPRQPLDP